MSKTVSIRDLVQKGRQIIKRIEITKKKHSVTEKRKKQQKEAISLRKTNAELTPPLLNSDVEEILSLSLSRKVDAKIEFLGAAAEIKKLKNTKTARLTSAKKFLTPYPYPKKKKYETDDDYITLIRGGVLKKSITHLIEATEIPVAEMADIMETTPRKLAAIKPDTLMEKSQSEKAVNIARLYALGEEVFGSTEEFNKWMNGRVPALGKKKPKEYLDTTTGINMLMDELVRMQHGVYS